MQILLATTNPHKLAEVRSVFDTIPGALPGALPGAAKEAVTWRLLDEVSRDLPDAITEPVEDQLTFEGNAKLKARHYARQSGLICLADDSGIEVDALGGAPGVFSARYSGAAGPRDVVDPANNAKLLESLRGLPVEQRTARYVCVLALVIPASQGDATELTTRGTLEGRILLPEEADDARHPERGRGHHGFGYDGLFVLPGGSPHGGLTTAQITPDEKNAISHRGDASRKLAAAMRDAGLI